MSAERFGRWRSTDAIDFAKESGQDAALALTCSLHALMLGAVTLPRVLEYFGG